jgi:tetratricopeptide (TPR) repeat protein
VRAVLHREEVPEPVAQIILEKAEGNPFFLEELSKAVAEHEDLRAEIGVPDTVQGVLMARIDRLAKQPRRVLQTASILGREFSLRLLGAIWEGPGALEPHLLELRRLEFIYEQSGAEESVYVFKHALTQDVAYESLLVSRRRALHAAAGRALETLYADRLVDVYDKLAYHYSRTEEAPKAVEYLTLFAEKAARSYANVEALTALQEAQVHAERLPGEERDRRCLDLVHRQANSLLILGRFRETLDLLLHQQELLERLHDPSLTGSHYFWLGYTFGFLGNQERSAESARCAVDEAEQSGDEATLGKAYWVLARASLWLSYYRQAIEQGRRAVSLLEPTRERRWLAETHWVIGWAQYFLGEFELALEGFARVRAVGEAMADARLQCYADWMSGLAYATRGDWEMGIEACQRGLERSPSPLNTALALAFLGFADLEKGDAAQALHEFEEAIAQLRQFGFLHFQGWHTTLLAQAYLLQGEVARAQELALQGLAVGRETNHRYGVGLAQRVLGQIALGSGALPEAEVLLKDALGTFASIQARFEVGRTHLTLAQLASDRGDDQAAATHLKEARDLFNALQVRKYVERTEQLSEKFRAPLPGV